MEKEFKSVGRCPLCGGSVVKTGKGFRCENNIGEEPKCELFINGVIGNRKMADNEISELLAQGRIMLDGFANREWKTFPTILVLNADGSVSMDSRVSVCPRCGGEIRVGAKAFNCSNYSREDAKCEFVIWRNICGHLLTEKEVREICENGMTTGEIELYGDDGHIYRKRLGLSPDKLKVLKV